MKKTTNSLGVVIGRFHVDELHEGHTDLLQEVEQTNDKMLIIVGLSPCMCTTYNPLDFHTRRHMLRETFPNAAIAYVNDTKEDIDWSDALDAVVAKYGAEFDKITLYGCRDSFIKHYETKRYATQELVQRVIVSGTEIRRRIAAQSQNSKAFRAGAIWYALNQYPRAIPTVDIAVIHNVTTKNSVSKLILLGKKPKEKGYRFPGGFVTPGETWEQTAVRELFEETNVKTNIIDLKYCGSFVIDDWRYRKEVDKITSTLFKTSNWQGIAKPGDDIFELQWFPLTSETLHVLEEEHIEMFTTLLYSEGAI